MDRGPEHRFVEQEGGKFVCEKCGKPDQLQQAIDIGLYNPDKDEWIYDGYEYFYNNGTCQIPDEFYDSVQNMMDMPVTFNSAMMGEYLTRVSALLREVSEGKLESLELARTMVNELRAAFRDGRIN